MKKRECLNPRCKDGVYARGLCNSCYQVAIRIVSAGLTNWESLEKKGKSLPLGVSRKVSEKRGWFTEE